MTTRDGVKTYKASTDRNPNSIETILTFENADESRWSVIWSTAHIPGMDTATGAGPRGRVAGRRRLRMGALVLGGLLSMHCRVSASALTGGLFIFLLFLVLSVGILANPLRHFEIYLGQWSVSGPGRAFRIIPMLDGIGIAICINAIVRAINCCALAAITAVYVLHSLADAKLPFTYCRDFELKSYEPEMKDIKSLNLEATRFSMETGIIHEESTSSSTTVGLNPNAWRNITLHRKRKVIESDEPEKTQKIAVCKETYNNAYPPLFSTPPYNFFYVEVVQLRSDYSLIHFNITLLCSMTFVWGVIWLLMITERWRHGRLIWNNTYSWFVVIPWLWVVLLAITAGCNLVAMKKPLQKVFKIGAKEGLAAVADALEVSLYIHAVSVGTEIVHGKGLNYYASGHIDPYLNTENVWHSGLVLILSVLHSCGGALCALVDCIHPKSVSEFNMRESTLWIIPMYSKCTSMAGYSHLMTTLIFGGLMFSYIAVAFILVKTALHTIFEYKVKLVFVEQVVVGALVLTCLAISLMFATNGGLALLESVDAIMTSVAVSYVCLIELCGILYVYRGRDFLSDLNVSTEENTCSSRISTQLHIIPFVTLGALIMKSVLLFYAELPTFFMYVALAPFVGVLLAVPLRACHNAYIFLKPAPRHGT